MAIISPKTLLMQAAQDLLKPRAFGDGSMDAYKKREGIIEAEGQYKKRSRMAGDALANKLLPRNEQSDPGTYYEMPTKETDQDGNLIPGPTFRDYVPEKGTVMAVAGSNDIKPYPMRNDIRIPMDRIPTHPVTDDDGNDMYPGFEIRTVLPKA